MSGAAAAAAAVAVLLSLVLLVVVVRQRTRLKELGRRIDSLDAAQQTSADRIEELTVLHGERERALELALRDAHRSVNGNSATSSNSDDQISVITDISDRRRAHDDVDLSTARIASVTLGGPLIKVAAFSHGMRHALDEDQRMRISYAVRKELRRQRKMRRRRRASDAPSKRRG